MLLAIGFAVIALLATFIPRKAEAFWPFSTNADAASNSLIPSSSTPVLAAAANANPTAEAPSELPMSGGTALVPHSGPEGAGVDSLRGAAPDRISVYVVRQGDTLSEIAGMFGVSVNTIVWANDLGSSRIVRQGQTLIILPVSGVEKTIQKGDTLKSIAAKYKADAEEIAEFNGLDPAAALAVGTTIIIPGGEIAVPVPAKKPSTSPYLGGSGASLAGYYGNPLPGGVLTQALHGWNGIDLAAPRGTSVRAMADGTVIIARNSGWNGGYGNYVVITHGNGTQTLYSHLLRASVAAGDTVVQGQVIGTVGNTGHSTGPHLHFEVRGAKNPFSSCPVGATCQPQ